MSILPHLAAGAVAGSLFQNPFLAGLAGGVSHYVVDFIPHFDPEIRKSSKMVPYKKLIVTLIVVFEVSVSLVILWFLKDHPNLFWGGVMGPGVDIDNFLQYTKFNKRYGIFPLLSKIGITIHDEGSKMHHKLKLGSFAANLIVGIILQGIIFFGGLYYLKLKYSIQVPFLG